MNRCSQPSWFSLKEWPKNVRDREAYVDPIFTTIAAKYDFMTRVLSFGQERRWKTRVVRLIPKNGSLERILDLASGTGEFPLLLRHAGLEAQIIGLDRNPTMLGVARQKCARQPEINFIQGDLMQIPFKDHSFDVITMGYGLRYVVDIRQTLQEVFRLLRSGGRFVSLEFGVPNNHFYRRICFAYLLLLGSFWGVVLHRKGDTYWHIVESLKAYPGQETVGKWLKDAGFGKVEVREQLGGIITILSGTRP